MHQHQGIDDDAQDGRSLLLVLHTHQLQKVLSVGKGEEDKFCCLPEHPGVVWGQRHLVGIPERIIVCMLVSFYSKHESLSLSEYLKTDWWGYLLSSPGVLYCPFSFGPSAKPSNISFSQRRERCSRSSVLQPESVWYEKFTISALNSASIMDLTERYASREK